MNRRTYRLWKILMRLALLQEEEEGEFIYHGHLPAGNHTHYPNGSSYS